MDGLFSQLPYKCLLRGGISLGLISDSLSTRLQGGWGVLALAGHCRQEKEEEGRHPPSSSFSLSLSSLEMSDAKVHLP